MIIVNIRSAHNTYSKILTSSMSSFSLIRIQMSLALGAYTRHAISKLLREISNFDSFFLLLCAFCTLVEFLHFSRGISSVGL